MAERSEATFSDALREAVRPLGEVGTDYEQRVDWPIVRRARLDSLQAQLRAADIAGVVVQRLGNLRFLTSMRPFISLTYYPRYAAYLPASGEPWLLSEAGDIEYANRSMPWLRGRVVEWSYDVDACIHMLADVIRQTGGAGARIGYDDIVSHTIITGVEAALPGTHFVDASPQLTLAKAIKHPEEIKVITKAAELVEIGMRAARDAIRPGLRECDVAAETARAMLEAGADALVCYPQVSTDPLRRMGTDKRIHPDDLVLIDLNISYCGYIGDMARTYAVGTPSAEQKRVFATQISCLRTGLDMFRDGVRIAEIQAELRKIVEKADLLDGWASYITGHGIGMDDIPYEEPLVGDKIGYEDTIRAGMVAAFEPGFFRPGVGAIRNEEMVVATDTESLVLTSLPYDTRFR